ncbi:MAG: hypothetical protein JNJ99_14500 [Crocinitomicaceae bacterium]|nr:hypothetical protein [Crocinitomicaceae bacterium]
MGIKFAHSILVLLAAGFSFSQNFNDTLYYKSGLERACTINHFDSKNLNYTYVSSKKDTLTHSVKLDQLKYFVIYDSSQVKTFSSKESSVSEIIGTDSLKQTEVPDSILIRTHSISVNPLSVPLLAANIHYIWRFGSNRQFGLHIPVRTISPILYNGNFAFYTGAGMSFFISNTEKFSMFLDITPSIYIMAIDKSPDDLFYSVSFSMGFVRYFNSRLGVSGSIGAGPGFSDQGVASFPLPIAHIGITTFLGRQVWVKRDAQR